MFRAIFNHPLINTLGKRKASKTFPKSAFSTLGEQKRPKVLPKGLGGSLKCISPTNNSCHQSRKSILRTLFTSTSPANGKYNLIDRRLFLAVLDGVADGAEVLAAGLD